MRKSGFIFCVLLAFIGADAFACTTAIISAQASSTGRPLLWKQRDSPDELNALAYLKGEKYSFTALFGSIDVSFEKAYCGANDQGFAIFNNLSYNLRPDSLGTGTAAGELMKEALGTCRTVDDFEKLLAEKGVFYRVSTNFGVIDAFGGAAYFEASEYGCRRYNVSDSPDGYLFRTNYSLSGHQDKGKGYVRYLTAGELMKERASKGFSPEWLIDGLGRSFFNAQTGKDLKKTNARSFAPDFDFIPRMTTASSMVIEGVADGDALDGAILWTAIGYTPCCYAVPVWVAAGDDIPSIVTDLAERKAPASVLANSLKHEIHPLTFEGGEAYIDIKTLRKEILPKVRKAEKAEFKAAETLVKEFRTNGFDRSLVKTYNEGAEKRFEAFNNQFTPR